MKNPTTDCPPFTKRQLDQLEDLKAEIEKRDSLSASDPEFPKIIKRIDKRIDDLSVKALRFGLLKNLPAESRRPGFFLEIPTHGGRLPRSGEYEIPTLPGFGEFHPDLPFWAKEHFVKWIRQLRSGLRRYDAHDVLPETGIVGIETGMPGPPIELEDIEHWELIKRRVLELRGVPKAENEDDDSGLIPAVPIESKPPQGQAPPYTLTELQQELHGRMKVAPAKAREARTKNERKRTRKNSATWDMVIDKLVDEKLLPKKITPQALRGCLKRHFPDFPWHMV
jgi:hypothetical protein